MNYSGGRLRRVITWLGAAIGLTIAIVGPFGYLVVAYSKLNHAQSMLTDLKAARLAKYIYVHRELWQYNQLRLAELIEVPEAKEDSAWQRIFDSTGQLVLEEGEAPAFPVRHWSAPVVVAGAPWARIETAATLRPLLLDTLIVAVFSNLFGLLVFFVFRILPLRIIDRTLVELETTQARYRPLFDANPFPMVVVHRDTLAFLSANQAAIDQYGGSREEFLAMRIPDMRPSGDVMPQRMIDLMKNPTAGAEMFSGQRHLRKDGTVIDVEITSRAIEFDGQPAALSLAMNVTERNRAERERRLAEDKLRQSQKMEAVGQLTGGIAHDFNNLLMVIIANIEALQEEHGLASEPKSRLKEIDGAVDRAAELTRQLLAFSRKQPLRAQVTDIDILVAGTLKLLRRSLGAQVEITTVAAGGLWPVSVDRTQLETALVNLCVNARDAMPSGGKLLIETRNETLDADDLDRHSDVAVGDYVVLAVTDTGVGMPPEVVDKVFEPFFTTKELGKGTGLGLSMVYGFIKQSNGHIEVESTPGRGSTFRLYLPRTAEAISQAAPVTNSAIPRGHERILVVEDEPDVRANTAALLRSLGYDVAHAADGVAGLAVVEAATRPFDLLLTDLMMPRLDGRGLAAAVERRWPGTKIIFMSGYAEGAVGGQGGIDDGRLLLSKPFRKAELAYAIRHVLAEA
jgi:PAS domain S-box-containing protein